MNRAGRQKTKNPRKIKILRGFSDYFGRLETCEWWRRRESNPRPEALYRQFYILSAAI